MTNVNSVAIWYALNDRICSMFYYKKNNTHTSWKISFRQTGIPSIERVTIKL